VTDTTKFASATITVTIGTVKLVPASLDFGPVKFSKTKTMATTLTNTGSTTLSTTSITITGTNPDKFSETNTCTPSVGAGKSCSISVTFTPKTVGSFAADVSISDSSADSPQQVTLSGTGCSRCLIAAAVRSALATNRTAKVPSPTGPSNVGTRVMNLVDATRVDPYLANGTKRDLLVRFWYPTSLTQGCKLAEYTTPRVWNYFSQLAEIPLPEVRTNSCLDAPITEGAHPVVVFTHGYTGTFTDYTFLFEDLASRGYIVASVAHTYETTAVDFPDGRFVKSVLGSHLGKTARSDEQTFSFAVSVRLSDLKFVVNELERQNADAESPLFGKLDMSRVAVAGHSLGGLTALLGVEEEPRFRAGVSIDGVVPDSLFTATETAVLILAAGREQWGDDECRLWSELRGPRLAVNLKGSEHVTPSDAVWLAKGAIKTGTVGTEKTIASVRNYIAVFLDVNLRDKPLDPLLTGPSSDYPDADVTTQTQSPCGEARDRFPQ
jgi:dienelactone hydrolase